MPIRAIANNDIALLAWSYDQKIANCLGFAVYRTDQKTGVETPLPAWVGFAGDAGAALQHKTTEVWPVQKYSWRDFTARRGGTYKYRVVPMVGVPGNLQSLAEKQLVSDPVSLTPDHGPCHVYFNRGILSTQALTRALPHGPSGKPSAAVLRTRINQPGDPLRTRLAGDAIYALTSLLERAKQEGGESYAALYELNDMELVRDLAGASFVHLILSNSATDANTGEPDATNAAARQTLHDAGNDILDRMLAGNHIGHNKFVVYVDKQKKPKAVLTGSTNWTSTGLCAQSNNAVILESPELAQAYLDYWNRLKQDDSDQAAPLRTADHDTPVVANLDDGDTSVRVWFSPNTAKKTKPKDNPPAPVDLDEVFALIGGAEQAVLFLAFIPGSPSIMDAVREVQLRKRSLFVRGALTDQQQAMDYIDLYHREGGEADARVVPALGIPDQFGYWEAELYKLGHAVIHDKIVVVDPFSANCAVITGSHNLGYKASYQNDENLVILRGNRAIAEAYTAHVLDIYDHYRWRFVVQEAWRKGRLDQAWAGLSKTDSWQDKYFLPDSPTRKDWAFWQAGITAAPRAVRGRGVGGPGN